MTQKKPSPLDIGQTREIVGTPFILRRNCFKSLTENSSCLAVEECIRSMPTLWGDPPAAMDPLANPEDHFTWLSITRELFVLRD